MVNNIIPTILLGEVGFRLWPVLWEHHPKPFIRLAYGQSLLQKAFLRGTLLVDATGVMTVTNREFFFKAEDELRDVNEAGLATSYILEPYGHNTAAAIAADALDVLARYLRFVLVSFTVDIDSKNQVAGFETCRPLSCPGFKCVSLETSKNATKTSSTCADFVPDHSSDSVDPASAKVRLSSEEIWHVFGRLVLYEFTTLNMRAKP